jgi:hypothetical protein
MGTDESLVRGLADVLGDVLHVDFRVRNEGDRRVVHRVGVVVRSRGRDGHIREVWRASVGREDDHVVGSGLVRLSGRVGGRKHRHRDLGKCHGLSSGGEKARERAYDEGNGCGLNRSQRGFRAKKKWLWGCQSLYVDGRAKRREESLPDIQSDTDDIFMGSRASSRQRGGLADMNERQSREHEVRADHVRVGMV